MNKKQHLLITLMEECAEVQHAVAKVLRFGDSMERVNDELNDLAGIVALLKAEGITEEIDPEKIYAKIKKVRQYMQYAIDRGAVYEQDWDET